MSQHTPGPWKQLGAVVWDESMGRVVAMCASKTTQIHEDTANARLIAAAPDLLDALRDALNLMDALDANGMKFKMRDGLDLRQRTRAVIAKAEGR